ncbi:MAG: hypothetical protein HON68_02650 [Gammaproteobacteria bacterium]|jgi:hypothetical protein|nr:hypothetical protein [Gammaproteobacteria bacterium]MBT3488957.1 hypothetical protein [Gammaproteobacteria bacterium]MBT3719402.1 hypothetical protein [Gammaproteobacteria bacterium]MBT3844551.1 hypothetical protein [Gammaproteobacteria bacterium]MBT3893780.1 hypothetical protein [Gammaproteobacteria bacterium]
MYAPVLLGAEVVLNRTLLQSLENRPAVYEFSRIEGVEQYPAGCSATCYIGSSIQFCKRMQHYLGGRAQTNSLRCAIHNGVMVRWRYIEHCRVAEAKMIHSFIRHYGERPRHNRVTPALPDETCSRTAIQGGPKITV